MQALASAVKHDAPCVVVYNPLPWTRSGFVEMQGDSVFVKDVPPCGYRTQPLPPVSIRMTPRKTPDPATIENAYFKLTLDPAEGAVTSLVDKRTGREWINSVEARGLGSKGVLVTAFGQNHDGEGTLLRIWEHADVSGELTVDIPGNFTSATPVNLRGENSGKQVAIKTGKLGFNLPAYAPASFILE